MELVGKIRRIEVLKIVSEKFKSQEIIIETEEQYPQIVSVQFAQDKTNLLTGYLPGQKVRITFSIRGKEVTAADGALKVYNTLSAWKIEILN